MSGFVVIFMVVLDDEKNREKQWESVGPLEKKFALKKEAPLEHASFLLLKNKILLCRSKRGKALEEDKPHHGKWLL